MYISFILLPVSPPLGYLLKYIRYRPQDLVGFPARSENMLGNASGVALSYFYL